MGKKLRGNGEGTLYWSEALQKWVAQYWDNGRRQTMTQKKNEKASDFKKRYYSILADINAGTYVGKCKDTCLSILEKYIEQKHIDGATSDRSYLRDLDTLSEIKETCSNWINKNISDVTSDDIEKSKVNIRKYSNNTIDKIWIQINKIFKIAIARRKIIFNPMLDETLTKPISIKETVPIEALSVEEENRLLQALENSNSKYKNIILLQLYTGARIGEILALSRDCIDMENNTITIYRTITRKYVNVSGKRVERRTLGKHTKTYSKKTGVDKGKRTFPMTPKVKNIILELLDCKMRNMDNLLFYDYRKNQIICDNSVNSFLDRLNIKYSISTNALHTHRLRHTFITRCQEKGIPLPVVQALVGHIEGSSITTSVYTSISLDFMNTELVKIS